MEVQTFESEVEKHPEACDEARRLIDELNLTGQKKLINPDTKERSPYRKMLAEESTVYKTICPQSCKLEDYEDEAIPLRVLQVGSHANELFDELQVWYRTNADIKDPVLVGVKGEKYSNREFFLLARWGEELDEYPVLRRIAAKLLSDKWKHEANKLLLEVKQRIASPPSDEELLGGANMPHAYF
jgi:hypothetical protein